MDLHSSVRVPLLRVLPVCPCAGFGTILIYVLQEHMCTDTETAAVTWQPITILQWLVWTTWAGLLGNIALLVLCMNLFPR